MAFKVEELAAPLPTRNRTHEPAMVKAAETFVALVKAGKDARIPCTGDEKLSTTPAKGQKQSPREKSARAEAGKLSHFITTKYDTKTRTKWEQSTWTCYVAPALVEGAAESNGATA